MIRSYEEIVKIGCGEFTKLIVPLVYGKLILFENSEIGYYTIVVINNEVYYIPKSCKLYKAMRRRTIKSGYSMLMGIRMVNDNLIEFANVDNIIDADTERLIKSILKEGSYGQYTLDELSGLLGSNSIPRTLSKAMLEKKGQRLDLTVPINQGGFLKSGSTSMESIIGLVDNEVVSISVNSKIFNSIKLLLQVKDCKNVESVLFRIYVAKDEFKVACISKSSIVLKKINSKAIE